jgi:hypothetical protein
MAYQSSTAAPRGENLADPTRAGRPAPETYKAPAKETAQPVGQSTGRGMNQYRGPSSVSVRDSALSAQDFDIADPVKQSLIDGGFGDRSESGAPIDDLQRKIDTTPLPSAHGMQRRGVDSGSPGGKVGALDANPGQPARQPPRGQGQM